MESTPTLPLDWTRIKRRRTTREQGTSGKNPPQNHRECLDPTCCAVSLPAAEEKGSLSNFRLITGTAIFCLPDPESDWFQGYLVTDDNKSYGILCIANDDRLDACLKCDDYRLLDVQVNDYQLKEKNTYKNIICRGGDAMKWHHRHVSFETSYLLTGKPAFDDVRRYFGSLIRNLGGESAEDSMPAVAVTKGSLQLWIPDRESPES